jgi:predicted Zn-dependent protease
VLQVNAETHPTSWQIYGYLGQGYELLHDNTRALAAYRHALALNPSDTQVQQQIDQLQRVH